MYILEIHLNREADSNLRRDLSRHSAMTPKSVGSKVQSRTEREKSLFQMLDTVADMNI